MVAAMVKMAVAILIQLLVLFERGKNGQPPGNLTLQTRMMRATGWKYSPRLVPINFHLYIMAKIGVSGSTDEDGIRNHTPVHKSAPWDISLTSAQMNAVHESWTGKYANHQL